MGANVRNALSMTAYVGRGRRRENRTTARTTDRGVRDTLVARNLAGSPSRQ